MNKRLIDFMVEAIRYSIENPSAVGEFEIWRQCDEPSKWNDFTVTIAPGYVETQWTLKLEYYSDGEHIEHFKSFKGMGLSTWAELMQFLIDCFEYMHNNINVLLDYSFGWSDDTANSIDSAMDELRSLKYFGQEEVGY